eukprot:232206_1
MWLICIGVATLLFWVVKMLLRSPQRVSFKDKHCIITGGSSGIGLEAAKLLARRGANVTLVARDKTRLEEAIKEVQACARNPIAQNLGVISCNVSGPYQDVENCFMEAERLRGPCYGLFNFAGKAFPLTLDNTPAEDIDTQIKTNLVGSIYATKSILSGMKKRRAGRILFTSSMAGQLGIHGHSVYGASKFGIRGFAEALQMEVKAYGITVSVGLPPDTDTPGLREEDKIKNETTAKITAAGGYFSAEKVADEILSGVEKGKFLISIGFTGFILTQLTSGFSPPQFVTELIWPVIFMPILKVVSIFLHYTWYGLVEKEAAMQYLTSTSEREKKTE